MDYNLGNKAYNRIGEKMKEILKTVILVVMIVTSFYLALKIPHRNYREEVIQDENEYVVHINRSDGSVDHVELEQYLCGVVGCEMSPTYDMEALKAQSVAARTFVLSRNLNVDDSTASQVYMDQKQLKKRWGNNYDQYYKKVKQAVDETKGQYMSYNGQIISALFHAMSCGKTNNNAEYFGGDTPYLVSVDSSFDAEYDDFEVVTTFDIEELCLKLKVDEFVVNEIEKYPSGYVKTIVIDDISFSGRAFREGLALRSSAFSISIDNQQVKITTYGYGHGVGMSQRGALILAQQNKSYQDILNYYYQGIKIETLE